MGTNAKALLQNLVSSLSRLHHRHCRRTFDSKAVSIDRHYAAFSGTSFWLILLHACMHLSICLSVLESISLSHTHTHICAHSHSLLLFWTDQIKSDTQTPKDVFHTYSSTAPPPRHTKTQTKTFVSNTLTLLTHACVDVSTNKQTNTHFGQICSWCQTRPADPPPQQQPPQQIHWSHAGTASAVTNTSTPRSFKISPSALTSPLHHLLFPLHTHTHTQGIWPFYCPICSLYKLSVHFET